MLEPPFPGPGQAVHEPVRPFQAQRFKFLVVIILVKLCQGEKGRGGIDVFGGKPFPYVILEPLVQELLIILVLPGLHDS